MIFKTISPFKTLDVQGGKKTSIFNKYIQNLKLLNHESITVQAHWAWKDIIAINFNDY